MNPYDNARTVEQKGKAVLIPYLETIAENGYVIETYGDGFGRFMQMYYGDVIVNLKGQGTKTIEFKIEQSNIYGNFFLETYGNLNLTDELNYIENGINIGWLIKLRGDILFYYFVDEDLLYSFNIKPLQRWALGHVDRNEYVKGNIDFREAKLQKKYNQVNNTLGVPINIGTLSKIEGVFRNKNGEPLKPRLILEQLNSDKAA